jgi:hypothetical protein
VNAFGLDEASTFSVLAAGILAPSADNRHLFKYRVSADDIAIETSPALRVGGAKQRLLAWISIGAVVENICIAASVSGVSLGTAWSFDDRVICRLRARPGPIEADPLQEAVATRHTNRRRHFGPPLGPEERERLGSQLDPRAGVKLVWLDAPEVRRRAARLMYLAERERFRRRELHEELFASLRFDLRRNEPCISGIPISATEIDPFTRIMFSWMRHWPLMRTLKLIGVDRIAALRAAYLPARSAANLILLLADGDLPDAAARTGRAMQRIWLQATLMQRSVQPLAAGVLYAQPAFSAVSAPIRQTLESGWRELAGTNGAPLMLLRVGYSEPASGRTSRPPIETFVEQ